MTREVLDLAIVRDLHEIPRRQGYTYTAFVDPSGGSADSFNLAIARIDRHTKRGVLDAIRERRPPFSPEAVVEEYARLLHIYRVTRVEGDHYGGEWPRERFRLHGINYVVADQRKSDIYLEFLPLLNAGRVELLDERRPIINSLGSNDKSPAAGSNPSTMCPALMTIWPMSRPASVKLLGRGPC